MYQYCPTCGKPLYNFFMASSTVTTGSSVWPYCQCPQAFTLRLTVMGSTATWALVPVVNEPKSDVPKAFYDAFEGKELLP